MRAAIISFTEHGAVLAGQIREGYANMGILCQAWIKRKQTLSELPEGVQNCQETLKEWTKQHFSGNDLLVFIGATGIAVRSIAPFVKSKKTDPAVIVLDEQGRHVISLLSGHIGGANTFTLLTAEITGAEPVITTATDLHGLFAVDAFAARRDLYMDSMPAAKEIAAELVAGKHVGMRSAYPVFGRVPGELDMEGTPEVGFSIDIRREDPYEKTLHLVPRIVVLGIGCKKGTEEAKIRALVEETLNAYGIFEESVEQIVSIDLKKEETGIQKLAEAFEVPFITYTAEELQQVESEEGFTESDFVRSVTGVGNVCERAALKGAGAKRLLIPKTARAGVTVAAAVRDYTICMED
jgi:cobalt-precorrin 5A hydrolase